MAFWERLRAWLYVSRGGDGDGFQHRIYMSPDNPSQARDLSMPTLDSEQERSSTASPSINLVMPSLGGEVREVELKNGQGDEGSVLTFALSGDVNSEAATNSGVLGGNMSLGSFVKQSPAVSTSAAEFSTSAVELLSVAPVDGIPHVFNADAMEVFVRQAKTYIQLSQWDEARAACGAALSVAPDMAEAYKQVGNLYQEAGRGAEALGFYGRALLVNPEFPEVYANLGSFCARQGEWSDAERYYRKAIALRPDYAPFHKPLARVLEASGRSSESDDVWVKAVALDANASGAEHYRAGQLLLEQGDEEKAIACFRRAVEAKDCCIDACHPLAELLEKQGDWQTATTYYRKAFEASLKQADPQADVGRLGGTSANASQLTSRSLGGAAQPQLSTPSPTQPAMPSPKVTRIPARSKALPGQARVKVIRSQPNEAIISSNSADSLNSADSGELTQIKDTIAVCNESLRANPNQPDVCRNLARSLTQVNQIEEAAQAWFKAFELEPDWATADQYCNLGMTLQQQGHLHQALFCYQQATRLNPELSLAHEQIVFLQEKQAGNGDSVVSSQKLIQSKEGPVTAKK